MKKTEDSVVTAVDDRFAGLTPSDLNEAEKQSVMRLAMNVLARKHRAGRRLGNPDETRTFLRLKLADYRNEVFGSVFLDLCVALSNVQLGRRGSLAARIRRHQLHISVVTVGASI